MKEHRSIKRVWTYSEEISYEKGGRDMKIPYKLIIVTAVVGSIASPIIVSIIEKIIGL